MNVNIIMIAECFWPASYIHCSSIVLNYSHYMHIFAILWNLQIIWLHSFSHYMYMNSTMIPKINAYFHSVIVIKKRTYNHAFTVQDGWKDNNFLMLPLEHSSILLTSIKRKLVWKPFLVLLRVVVLHRLYCMSLQMTILKFQKKKKAIITHQTPCLLWFSPITFYVTQEKSYQC